MTQIILQSFKLILDALQNIYGTIMYYYNQFFNNYFIIDILFYFYV